MRHSFRAMLLGYLSVVSHEAISIGNLSSSVCVSSVVLSASGRV